MSIEQHLPLIQTAAAVHAWRIVRNLGLPGCERADVCQDLLLEIIPRFGRSFNPDIASASTYVTVLARHAAHAVTGRYRRRMAAAGLEAPLEPDSCAADLTTTPDDLVAHELAIDVEHAVATLPRALRRLVDLLRVEPAARAKRESGLGHATFYRRLRVIRLHFLAEGLRPVR